MHAPQSGVLIWMVYSHLSQASVVDLSKKLESVCAHQFVDANIVP